jgi:plasmid stability protein
MQVTITVPDDLEAPLRRAADAQHRTAEEVALDILRAGLLDELEEHGASDLSAVVAAIRATPPNPQALHPARGSLIAALTPEPVDDGFDLAAWQEAWTAAEAEVDALARADDRAEGRS